MMPFYFLSRGGRGGGGKKIIITPNTLGFRPRSIMRKRSFPGGSYKDSIDKLVVLHVSYRGFYYIIMYHCHLLHCWWPAMGQVFTDHTCLDKQIKSRWSRLQILWDNMSNWKIKHFPLLKCWISQRMDVNGGPWAYTQNTQCGWKGKKRNKEKSTDVI